MVIDALERLRVIELGAEPALRYAGRLLVELGAEVIQVVRPGSSTTGAMTDGDATASLWLDVGKRSVTIESGPEVDQLHRLLGASDVLLHDLLEESLAAMGLPRERLTARHPRLIVLALTPFGATGPLRGRRTTPLIDLHAGGEGWELVQELAADGSALPSRAPVMTGGDATEAYCGLMAATGVVAAVLRRSRTGRGNVIDLSRQEASMWPARVELSAFPNAGVNDRRRTRERMPGGVLRTLDGWVEVMPFEERMWQGLLDAMGRPAWAEDERFQERMSRLALASEINPRLEAWTAGRTAEDVAAALQQRGCPAYPVLSVDGLHHSGHYADRGYFVEVDVPGTGRLRLPSTPFTGPRRALGPPPRPGQDSLDEVAITPVPEPPAPTGHRRAVRGFLDGIRVLDLTFNRAGPSSTAAMAALGAEVIRVESRARIDSNRLRRSVAGQVVYGDADGTDLETRWAFGSINMGKKSVLLNLQAPGVQDVLRRLVEVSDMVVESFTPGTIERYGIGFDTLQAWRNDVILLSINGFGRGGRHAGYRAYADIFGAAGGLQMITGYPDERPMQFVGRLDSVVGTFGLLGGLAALIERDATGTGQHVEVSAAEAVTSLLGAPMVDYLLSGRVATRTGNRVAHMAPHGCYRCRGADEWVAVAVATDDEWRALCEAIGQPEAAEDARFTTFAARKANEVDLDRLVESWTVTQDPFTAADRLQLAGIPAVASMRPDHLFHDRHLQERGAWVRFEHPVQGERFDLRLPWLFSDGVCTYGPAPLFGQHDAEVYKGLLGLTPAEVARLERAGVIA